MPNWKKLLVSGSDASLNSLTVVNGITGSLFGTSSWAVSASNALTASSVNPLNQNVSINGALNVTGSFNVSGSTGNVFTANVDTIVFTGSLSQSGSVNVNGTITATSFTGSLFGTASQAVSSSYAISASYAPSSTTASYALTASYVNPLRQDVVITGSLNISGSTTQVGNNTLLGNTLLSGSIIISGSENPSTPTVQIFGDTQHTGVVRLNPIARNIDNSISASYIYVSGSTNDLYFTQNGNGYGNTTRLRWLEGNLYTGLLNGGLITSQSSTVYQVSSGSGIIVNLNASLNDNPYPTIQYLNWGNLSASIASFTASYQQAFVGIDSTGNIYAQGTPFSNGQFNTLINIGNVLFQNQSTINGFKTQPSVAYGFEQAQNIFNRAFGPLKLSGYTLSPSGSSTGSLVVGSGTAYAPGANYTINPNEPSYTIDSGTNISKIFRYYQSGSSWGYLTNGGAGYATIDPTQYSNNGLLTPVGAGNWSIQRCFWYPNSVTKAIVVYYGNAIYPTETEALANISFESFVEAPNTAANAIYLGAIIINQNGVFTSPNTFTIYPGGLFRQVGGSGGGGSVVTQTLSGLSDVNISGPTNYQALVYNTDQLKWINASFISASISGNAATATSASYATTASYSLVSTTSSYALTASNVNGYSTDGSNDYVPLWQPSGSLSRSIIYQKGNDTVGINRTNVTSTLDVLALSGNQIANFETQNFGDVYIQLKNNLGYGYIGVVNRDFYFQPGGSTKAILSASGEFGLGTFTPKYTLDVVGSGNLTNGLTATGSIKLPSLTNVNQLNIVGYDTTTGQLYYQSTSSLSITSASYAVSASYAQTASYAFAIPDQGYQFTQAVTSSTWTINHNLNTLTPLVDVYDSSYNQLIPAGIQSTTANTTIVTFSSAITGYAIVSKGSGINSETALTASLPLLGIITASAVNTTITFTKGNGTTFDVTVTQSGSVASASYADFAVTASYASTVGYNFEQLVGSTTWTVNHNLNNRHPLVQVYDSNHLVLIPQSISGSNVNTTIITFSTPMTGYARIV